MVYDADEEQTRFLHASSKMPAALDPQAFRPPTQNYVQNRRGAKAISTPGNANAWEALSRDYGELEWRRLFEPAIGLAEGGDRKSTRLNSSHANISYAVFCLKKKTQ